MAEGFSNVNLSLDKGAASRHVELLTGSANTPVCVRLLHDSDKSQPARKLEGTIADLWPEIEDAQSRGFGAFIVVNEGGNTDAEITNIRAVFVDADGIPEPYEWHVEPDMIVRRDSSHWHAYWVLADKETYPVSKFRRDQLMLAKWYGTDPSICNLSRVMRLPGTLHQKGTPVLVTVAESNEGLRHTAKDLTQGLEPLSADDLVRHAVRTASREVELDLAHNVAAGVQRIRDEIAERGEPVEGDKSDERTYILAARLLNLGLSDAKVLELLATHWAPSFDEGWLESKVRNAEAYMQNEQGADAVDRAENIFPPSVAAKLSTEPAEASDTGNDPWAHPYTHADIDRVRSENPPPKFLIPHFVLKGFNNMLTGIGGTFKSTIALDHGVCASAGAKLHGLDIEQTPAWFISYEDPKGMVMDRIAAIVAQIERETKGRAVHPDYRIVDLQPERHTHRLLVISPDGEVHETDDWKKFRDSLLASPGHKFVVLDSFYNAFDFRGPSKVNESAVMDVLGRLDSLCVAADCTLETICHPSRAAVALGTGSMGFGAAFDNGPRLRTYSTRVANVNAVDLKVVKYQYGPDGHQERLYHENGVARPTIHAIYIPLSAAVLEVAAQCAEGNSPIKRDRGTKNPGVEWDSLAVVDMIERKSGRRPDKREIRTILDAEVAQGRWAYVAGRGHSLAGYRPLRHDQYPGAKYGPQGEGLEDTADDGLSEQD